MVEHKELNEKLARWRGFRFQTLDELSPKYRHEANLCWVYSNSWIGRELPDFPNDLNSLFEWIVPRFPYVVLENCQGGYMATVSNDMRREAKVINVNPALALFKAVGQVINQEEGNSEHS